MMHLLMLDMDGIGMKGFRKESPERMLDIFIFA